MNGPRCTVTIYWFDIDMTAQCVLPPHRGPHCDGVRWFEHGMQYPRTNAAPVDEARLVGAR